MIELKDHGINRVDVIEALTKITRARTYLEIGVDTGECFLPVCVRRKVAVDPGMHISARAKFKSYLKYPGNCFNRYYSMTSDTFFETETEWLKRVGLDVVFVDGLHTYSQSLTDVKNSLRWLNERGFIVVHDCLPPSEAAAVPACSREEAGRLRPPGWTGEWCGDVWKTIVHLRSTEPNLCVFVLNCDYGVGVITRGRPSSMLSFSVEQISRLTYQDLAAETRRLLNLQEPEFLNSFVAQASRGEPAAAGNT